MRFLVVSPVIHKKNENCYGGYAPYVREMNIWFKYVDEVHIVAPLSKGKLDPLESLYIHPKLKFVKVPTLDFTSIKKALKSTFYLPIILFILFKEMIWASHIHLRCPSNMGLLGSLVQIFFPAKQKTVKYANNWDRNSSQSKTYRIQQKILINEFWAKNTKILVYGNWNEKSKNVIPFFTASYSESMRLPVEIRTVSKDSEIRLLFVGTITPNKRPLVAVKTLETLRKQGFNIRLDVIGGGSQSDEIKEYITSEKLDDFVSVLGKKSPDEVIKYFKSSHFLVFLSMSEGWPKVVAESMWWGCLPVTTNVSCVKQMVDDGKRGVLVEPDPEIVADRISELIQNPELYTKMCKEAMEWARQYTFERFEEEIVKLIKN
jgi:glycosyltransferase involved in cell wall biosynthesis